MLPFNALICLSYFNVFLQLAAQRSLLRNLPAAQVRLKISSCSGWIIVGNNLTHWVFVWGYCCLRVLLLKALCNILRCPQTQTDWQINFCLQIFDRPFHEGVYWKYSDFLNNYLKQTDADLNEICKTSFQHTVSQTCITAQFPPLTLLLLGLT